MFSPRFAKQRTFNLREKKRRIIMSSARNCVVESDLEIRLRNSRRDKKIKSRTTWTWTTLLIAVKISALLFGNERIFCAGTLWWETLLFVLPLLSRQLKLCRMKIMRTYSPGDNTQAFVKGVSHVLVKKIASIPHDTLYTFALFGDHTIRSKSLCFYRPSIYFALHTRGKKSFLCVAKIL